MLKSSLLAATVFGLCLTHSPHEAEACGPKLSVSRIKAPKAQQAYSRNRSQILVVGPKDALLIDQLKKKGHQVDHANTLGQVKSAAYQLVIVDEKQWDAAQEKFQGTRKLRTRRSPKATAKLAEVVLAQRAPSRSYERKPVTTVAARIPSETGGDKPRRPEESGRELGSDLEISTEESKSMGSEDKGRSQSNELGTKKSQDPVEWTQQVRFGNNQANLSDKAKRDIRGNAQWLKQNPRARVIIEGHTDSVGEASYNLELSERRANVARDWLLALRIDASRITVVPKGEGEPAVSPSTSPQNRRVVFIKKK